MTSSIGCCVSQQCGSSVLAGFTSSPAVAADSGVLGSELVSVVAVGASSVLVPEAVNTSGAPSPFVDVGSMLCSALRSGELLAHCPPTLGSLTGEARATSLGPNGVFRRVLMSLRAVGLAGVEVGAMLNLVAIVARRRIPAQICRAVVGLVSVVMACLHPQRAGANEGFQHQVVDISVPADDSHAQVSLADGGGLEDSPITVSHTSKVADFIGNESADDWFPGFCHASECTVIGVSMVDRGGSVGSC